MTTKNLIILETFLELNNHKSFRRSYLSKELGLNWYSLQDMIKYLIANKKITDKRGWIQWAQK